MRLGLWPGFDTLGIEKGEICSQFFRVQSEEFSDAALLETMPAPDGG
jgi:hypothetical protein